MTWWLGLTLMHEESASAILILSPPQPDFGANIIKWVLFCQGMPGSVERDGDRNIVGTDQ